MHYALAVQLDPRLGTWSRADFAEDNDFLVATLFNLLLAPLGHTLTISS